MISLSIPRAILEELRKYSEERGVTIEGLPVEIATQGMNPRDRAKKYIEASLELLEQAKEELNKGDLRQASEKIWGAAALAIKAYAFWREGKVLTKHTDLWSYKSVVAKELGEWIRVSWLIADAMHKNFYEGEADKDDIIKAYEEVEKLVKAIAKRIKASPQR